MGFIFVLGDFYFLPPTESEGKKEIAVAVKEKAEETAPKKDQTSAKYNADEEA